MKYPVQIRDSHKTEKKNYISIGVFDYEEQKHILIPEEIILVPEDNGKQNQDESFTNKYQKHVACSYGCKLVCVNDVDDKLSKSLTHIKVKML